MTWIRVATVFFLVSAACSCIPQPTPVCPAGAQTAPGTQISCQCANLEREKLPPEVRQNLETMEKNMSRSAYLAIQSLHKIEERCRDEKGWHPPPPFRRDSQWQSACSSTKNTAPRLLKALESFEPPGQPTKEEQNVLKETLASTLGNIAIAHPKSVCREDIIRALIRVLDTPESDQSIRVNYTALKMLSSMGEVEAVPSLVRALFIKGRKRPLALSELARVALNRTTDPEAVAKALVETGRMQNKSVNLLFETQDDLDVRRIKEQVALTLGELGITNDDVISYLEEELNHNTIDEFDREPAGGGSRFTPKVSRAYRRQLAARALGKLGHGPSLDVILGRLRLNKDGSSADASVDIAEIPGYLEAIGDSLLPRKTNSTLLLWSQRGDEVLGQQALRLLVRQADGRMANQLSKVASTMPDCPENARCLRRLLEELYIPALRAMCDDGPCWRERLAAEDSSSIERQQAAIQLVLSSLGDHTASDQARTALIQALSELPDDDGEALETFVFAIDRLSPRGCDAECLELLERFIDGRREESSITQEVRLVTSLLGRMKTRGR